MEDDFWVSMFQDCMLEREEFEGLEYLGSSCSRDGDGDTR